MQISLDCQKRPEGSKPRALRREGIIPATLYGHNGSESVALIVKEKDAQLLLKKASVNNTLVDVNVPHMPWNGKALIREVQSHPWKRNIYHLSFFSVAAQKHVEVSIPIKILGDAPGVKDGGGTLEEIITELKIQCSPKSIPESIDIDVSNMEIGAHLKVRDINLPDGVTAIDDPDMGVISLVAPTL
jgi:large subunit ribosomal protein L25